MDNGKWTMLTGIFVFHFWLFTFHFRKDCYLCPMLSVVLFIFGGVVIGRLLRRYRLGWVSRLTDALIWLLLLLLGVEAGSNPQVVGSLSTLGLEATLIALMALAGCCLLSWLMWRVLKLHKKEETTADGAGGTGLWQALRGSLIIVGWFVIGFALGLTRLVPSWAYGGKVVIYCICVLMCSVGISVGHDPETVRRFRSLNPRLALLPLVTITGTLVPMALLSLCMPHRSLTDLLAVGSGFGYYSLSSVFITQMRSVELGTVALLSNIVREVLTLLLAPLMVRVFGCLSPIACGGATTADTTLPVITRCCGPAYVPLSLYHGFLMDFSVPFIVTFFCSL